MTIKNEDRPSVLTKRKLVGGGSVFRYTDKPSKTGKAKKAKKAKRQTAAETETAKPKGRLSASEIARLFGA